MTISTVLSLVIIAFRRRCWRSRTGSAAAEHRRKRRRVPKKKRKAAVTALIVLFLAGAADRRSTLVAEAYVSPLPTPAPTILRDPDHEFDFRGCSDSSATADTGVDGDGIDGTAMNGATCSEEGMVFDGSDDYVKVTPWRFGGGAHYRGGVREVRHIQPLQWRV